MIQRLAISAAWAACLGIPCLAGEIARPGATKIEYEVAAPNLVVQLNASGEIAGCLVGQQKLGWPVTGGTRLAGCRPEGQPLARELPGGGWLFTRKWIGQPGHACTVTDQFTPAGNSVRWEVDIAGEGAPWSTVIETCLRTAPENTALWAPWSDPRMGAKVLPPADSALVPPGAGGNWADPLQPRPFAEATLWYGAPPFRYDNPRIAFCPFSGDLLCIPLATLSRERDGVGLSLALSPVDPILDLALSVKAAGELAFQRSFLRLSDQAHVRFAADLTAHEAGWRGGLRWMTRRYPEYFDPVNPVADELAGTGAYSAHETAFDAAKMKRMAFRTNWKASFDFPYMGMFLPPVGEAEPWRRFGGGETTVAAMRGYSRSMRQQGFHVLSYFNVTEFGARVKYPAPVRQALRDQDLWRDCNDYLYGRLADAILRVPDRTQPGQLGFYPRTRVGGPYFTWEDAIVLDCAEPAYQQFLLDQARRHLREIPDASGICIDRMDWLRMYNEQRDDGMSWYEGRPARSLLNSWRGLMDRLGPLFHQARQVVFVNNHDKRIDLLREVDGIFDEFTYDGAPLNTTALLCVRKPALGWTSDAGNLKPDPELYFHKYLYLGVYPMAPFPGNDHSLHPSPEVDRYYLDYGPLLDTLRGKKWMLEPDCIETAGPGVKANLFQVPGGYVAPLTFGGKLDSTTVRIRNVPGLDHARCEVLHPGNEAALAAASGFQDGVLSVKAPLRRGCAMLRIKTGN